MLAKPDAEQLRALHALSQSPGWSSITKLLEAELAKTVDMLTSHHEMVTLRHMQGRAQLVRELMKLVAESGEKLERLRESTL